jgi:2-dehydro-3-deoxy-D-gluconate 5-dehydrogenase
MDLTNHKDLLNLNGQRAIVTGGAVGIGYAISYRLAEAGAKVLIADISQSNLDEARTKLKDQTWNVDYILTDAANESDVKTMIEKATSLFGGIDILVNNAGIYPNQMIKDMSIADFDRVLSVNLKGVFMTTKYTGQQMIEQGTGGKIINISSVDALHPSSVGLAHYDASKHGVWGFTKNAALEFAPHNIWVNAVAPGGVTTPGTQKTQSPTTLPEGIDMAAMLKTFLNRIPMHRMGEPDDIGKVVLFLASSMSSYITGSQIVVDGGVLLS